MDTQYSCFWLVGCHQQGVAHSGYGTTGFYRSDAPQQLWFLIHPPQPQGTSGGTKPHNNIIIYLKSAVFSVSVRMLKWLPVPCPICEVAHIHDVKESVKY